MLRHFFKQKGRAIRYKCQRPEVSGGLDLLEAENCQSPRLTKAPRGKKISEIQCSYSIKAVLGWEMKRSSFHRPGTLKDQRRSYKLGDTRQGSGASKERRVPELKIPVY
ncbi:hypothetical protein J6590_066643 [Homalodisca vitripennis]|nr:hypothetical protein J6590_066643 [Homalodisca vitripennis]